MRRLTVLFLAVAPFLPGSLAFGQSSILLYGGLNHTVLSETLENAFVVVPREPTNGLHVGLAAGFSLSSPDQVYGLALQLNGTYAQRGATHRVPGRSIHTRLHYLELSTLLDMRFPFPWERLASHFSCGPTVGWLVSCRREDKGAGGKTLEASPCPEFRAVDFGLILGGDLELGVADQLGIIAGLRFHWGAQDIEPITHTRLFNRALELRGGLLYTIG